MAINIKTSERLTPMIYAYSTPEVPKHDGWVKIGYTERQKVEDRIKQQTHTADITPKLEWKGNAVFDDGTFDTFHDSDFHHYLEKLKIERTPKTEWFHIDGDHSLNEFNKFRQNRGLLESQGVISYTLRSEQEEAVERTVRYFEDHPNGEMLWNAKPRFGKTLTSYSLIQELGAKSVLILTNRPAIADSWYSDYANFLGTQSGYCFVSETASLEGRPLVCNRTEFIVEKNKNPDLRCIEFISLQDLKGSISGGGKYDKLEEVFSQYWDLVILDEAHEGVDTLRTAVSLENISHNFTLHLSGTPFKALAKDKFSEEAIFNWTYADEQKAKRDWDSEAENPYASLPELNLFTYQMSEMIKDEVSKGIILDESQEDYAFDLNEFFAVKNGKFVHDKEVDKFLEALISQEKYPFSTSELRNELKHTFWLLPRRVEIAKAMAKKLQEHPIFKEYEIVLAAGDGKLNEDDNSFEANKKSLDKVKEAIKTHEKTITLSVGQLTTGVTIPEWTAVLMLSNMKSPAEYMQAAFRAQNPYLYKENNQVFRKERAYVFDFDPIRTLDIYDQFANDLSSETSAGKGSYDQHKENVRELLNFFPVLGEDSQGKMVELDAERVLSIPKKLRAKEVVNRGFMCDFLFQNLTHVFNAPQAVIDAINKMEPAKEDYLVKEEEEDLYLNEEGEVEIPEEIIEQKRDELFGPKIYETQQKIQESLKEAQNSLSSNSKDLFLEKVKSDFIKDTIPDIFGQVKKEYGKDFTPSLKRKMESKLTSQIKRKIDVVDQKKQISKKLLENDFQKQLQQAQSEAEKAKVIEEYESKEKKVENSFNEEGIDVTSNFVSEATSEIVKAIETNKREKESQFIQSVIKDHLRGFSRTIPSFLMAYGDDETRLDNFDKIIPNDVFEEVTSISLDMFRKLRDGGSFYNEETQEEEYFKGGIFDPVVFDDSVREFLHKKWQLSDYFDAKQEGDIFDYIPPQKTNQIFTPKWVVKKMVDELEEQDPNCFNDPNKTFIDLYMKSGLYPAEIIKRLYQSPKMKELFPDEKARLKHIIENQVYGLSPTEIIFRIAKNFILGSPQTEGISHHNFRQEDSLALIKEGNLEVRLDELYPERK